MNRSVQALPMIALAVLFAGAAWWTLLREPQAVTVPSADERTSGGQVESLPGEGLWTPLIDPSSFEAISIDFRGRKGVMASAEGRIALTTDGGLTWAEAARAAPLAEGEVATVSLTWPTG